MASLGARLGRRRPFEERFVDDRVVAVRLTTGTTPGCPRHDRVPAEAHQPEHQDDGGDDPEHVRSETQSAQHECEQQYQQGYADDKQPLASRRGRKLGRALNACMLMLGMLLDGLDLLVALDLG